MRGEVDVVEDDDEGAAGARLRGGAGVVGDSGLRGGAGAAESGIFTASNEASDWTLPSSRISNMSRVRFSTGFALLVRDHHVDGDEVDVGRERRRDRGRARRGLLCEGRQGSRPARRRPAGGGCSSRDRLGVHEHLALLDLDRVAGHPELGIARHLARAHVVVPVVPRAAELESVDEALTERAAAVHATVVDRVERALDVDQRQRAATGLAPPQAWPGGRSATARAGTGWDILVS